MRWINLEGTTLEIVQWKNRSALLRFVMWLWIVGSGSSMNQTVHPFHTQILLWYCLEPSSEDILNFSVWLGYGEKTPLSSKNSVTCNCFVVSQKVENRIKTFWTEQFPSEFLKYTEVQFPWGLSCVRMYYSQYEAFALLFARYKKGHMDWS